MHIKPFLDCMPSDPQANFKTIKKHHTGESQCPEKSQKYWIALRFTACLFFAGTTTTDF